jgi:hypothetical protein
MVDSTTGMSELRKEYIDGAVKAVALAEYKLKTLCAIDSSDAWIETYYRENNSELVGGTGSGVKGIPRLAPFPYNEVTETKIQSYILKYGMEGQISYEDATKNNIPMIQRTLLRIGRAVTYAIDVEIEAQMSANAGNAVAIASGYEWDSATIAQRDPIKDILDAIQTMRADNLNALNGNGYLVVNGTDYTNLMSNSKIVNNPTFKTADVVSNGVTGQVCGLKIMVTEAIPADTAYVVIAQEAMTWKNAHSLEVLQIEDAGIKTTIRAFEMGVCQVTAPNAICKITNTRK